jgi:hypothetical protein
MTDEAYFLRKFRDVYHFEMLRGCGDVAHYYAIVGTHRPVGPKRLGLGGQANVIPAQAPKPDTGVWVKPVAGPANAVTSRASMSTLTSCDLVPKGVEALDL